MTPSRTRQRPAGQPGTVQERHPRGNVSPDHTAGVRQEAESPGRREWRVRWRRAGWSPTTATHSRRFTRRADLDRFLDRLTSRDRPDLSPLSLLDVSWRHVGPWHAQDPDR